MGSGGTRPVPVLPRPVPLLAPTGRSSLRQADRSAGPPAARARKRRGSTAPSASGSRYREQRTVAGNGTGRQLGSRVRAHGKPCGRCRGGDMSTPQNVRLPGITCGRLQITAVRRGGRVDAALGACRTDLRIMWRPLLVIRVSQLVSRAAGHRWPALLDRAKCGRSGCPAPTNGRRSQV